MTTKCEWSGVGDGEEMRSGLGCWLLAEQKGNDNLIKNVKLYIQF